MCIKGTMETLLVVGCLLLGLVAANTREVCQWEQFKASCPPGEVIMMQKARYGRMEYGRCIKRDYGYVGCETPVLSIADLRCSGRRVCTINVPDKLFDDTSPCPEDLKMYLEANYTCQKVIEPADQTCRGGVPTDVPSSASGYLASVVTQETGCGSTSTPWRIKVPAGQRINVTLWDFGRHRPNISVPSNPSSFGAAGNINSRDQAPPQAPAFPHCHVYAILKDVSGDGQQQKSQTVCGGVPTDRQSHIFTSIGSELEVRLVVGSKSSARGEDAGQFMLHYQAIGCRDLSDLPGVVWRRQGSKATLSCQGHTGPQWQLTCAGNEWKGQYENCTDGGGGNNALSRSVTALHHSMVTLSHSSSLIIIVAVALFIGLMILLAGLLVIRRKRLFSASGHRHPQHPHHRRDLEGYHPKDAQYNAKTMGMMESHPPLLSRHDPFIYSPEENEYAYVDEYPYQPNSPNKPGKSGEPHQHQFASNPYETTISRGSPRNHNVPPPPPPVVSLPPKSRDTNTGTGLVQHVQPPPPPRSHDPVTGKPRDLPPQYFVLDPEALDGNMDGGMVLVKTDPGKGEKRDRSNEYT